MTKELIVAALQLPTLGINATRLEFYFKNASKRGARIVLFGEYVLNHFFKEIKSIPISMLKEQSSRHLNVLKDYAKTYDMVIIAPIIRIKGEKLYKSVAKISAKKISYYDQQILISYNHWNEEEFFANSKNPITAPMTFIVDGFKVMVMAGFELHFPEIWSYAREKSVDLVLIPTSSTFGSHDRWREIIKTQAFIYGCYVLRANRLGEYSDAKTKWRFYGDSMLVNPEGEVEMMLEDKESMLIEEIDKEALSEHRKSWKFAKSIKERV